MPMSSCQLPDGRAAYKPPASIHHKDIGRLQELTEEGIANDSFGLRGRLASELRRNESYPAEYGFEETRDWVERHVEWEVVGLDGNRSHGDVAVVSVRAVAQGDLGRDFEQLVVVANFVVIYGVGGEFPGIMGYELDGPPFVVRGILSNKYDWRKSRCEGLRC